MRSKGAVLIILGSGNFIMVLDSTMQLAIATYTLTTATLMLIGVKVGDIIGRKLAFRIGIATFRRLPANPLRGPPEVASA